MAEEEEEEADNFLLNCCISMKGLLLPNEELQGFECFFHHPPPPPPPPPLPLIFFYFFSLIFIVIVFFFVYRLWAERERERRRIWEKVGHWDTYIDDKFDPVTVLSNVL